MEVDSTDSEYDVFIPEVPTDNLEVDEEVYEILEYISLEWPSQTVCTNENCVFLGPNCENPQIMRLEFERDREMGFLINEKFIVNKKSVSENINRMRSADYIFGVTDNYIFKCDFELEKYDEYKVGNVGYGIFAIEDKCFFTSNGDLYTLNKDPELIFKNLHKKEINDIQMHGSHLITVSNDGYMKILDLEVLKVIKELKFDHEVNTVAYNGDKIVVGLDSGEISIVDEEVILWHKTPISMVKFLSNDAFITLSDEQAVLWDLSFTDEWQFHKYLHFVHAGQKFYKDCDIFGEMVVTTSEDGLCFFRPLEGI